MRLIKKNILIISQFFWPNNFRINDIISNLPSNKFNIFIISSKEDYIYNEKNKKKRNFFKCQIIKFPKKKFKILSYKKLIYVDFFILTKNDINFKKKFKL